MENEIINFIKFYSKAHYINENNVQESFDSDSYSKVFYSGVYDPVEKKFKGEWHITDYFLDNNGILHDKALKGDWEIWRK